jgi:peptidoglycan/LPS O-acetylase OafA/YrhL
MPIVLLFFHIKKIKPENLYTKLLIIILFITAARFCYVIFLNPAVDPGIRNCIPLRLDAILTGVVFACLKINNKEIYDKLLTKNIIVMNFLLLIIQTFFYIIVLSIRSHF